MKLDEVEIRKLVATAVKKGWASYPPDSPLNAPPQTLATKQPALSPVPPANLPKPSSDS